GHGMDYTNSGWSKAVPARAVAREAADAVRPQPDATVRHLDVRAESPSWETDSAGSGMSRSRRVRAVGGELPIMLPRRLNESTFAVMQPDPNRFPRQVSLRDGGPEWRSIGRLR